MVWLSNHPPLMPLATYFVKQFDRHGVEYFIANDHPLHAFRPFAKPIHLIAKLCQSGLLPLF